jgi:hypothetical protein
MTGYYPSIFVSDCILELWGYQLQHSNFLNYIVEFLLFFYIILLNVPAVLTVCRRMCHVPSPKDHSTSHTLSFWRPHLDALVLFGVYFGSKIFSSLLEIVGVRVPKRNFRDIIFFNIDLKYCNIFQTRCASATITTTRNTDIFNGKSILLIDLLN